MKKMIPEITKQQLESSSNIMYKMMKILYPICRSITGNSVRKTLEIIKNEIPIQTFEIPTGTPVLDWTIPKEWNIYDAYIKNSNGEKIIDFKNSNLSILNYSIPVHKKISFEELKDHLFYLQNQPDLIPYRTSYYNENWGFCLPYNLFCKLDPKDEYEVFIDSTLESGSLTYGESFLKGELDQEIVFSCYICHPSLCNDNLSGPVLLLSLINILSKIKLKYSYRFLFIPETIGAIAWLHNNLGRLSKIIGGFVVTCIGDSGPFTYKKTRVGNSYIDKVVKKALKDSNLTYKIREFDPHGSDERQFSSPGFNLNFGSLMRTPYAEYPEYHTSADNLNFIRKENLASSLKIYYDVIKIIETDGIYINKYPHGEPQLGRRGLYDEIGGHSDLSNLKKCIFWVLNFSDGNHSLLDISLKAKENYNVIKLATDLLLKKDILIEKENFKNPL